MSGKKYVMDGVKYRIEEEDGEVEFDFEELDSDELVSLEKERLEKRKLVALRTNAFGDEIIYGWEDAEVGDEVVLVMTGFYVDNYDGSRFVNDLGTWAMARLGELYHMGGEEGKWGFKVRDWHEGHVLGYLDAETEREKFENGVDYRMLLYWKNDAIRNLLSRKVAEKAQTGKEKGE